MNGIKNISIRVALFISILIIANWTYTNYFFPEFARVHAPLLLDQAKAVQQKKQLYYSASSEYSFAPNDSNEESISTLINQMQGDEFAPIVSAAHHAGHFKSLILKLDSSQVQKIILVMNYRSFSPEWIESHNENALNQSALIYGYKFPLLTRLMVSLNAHQPVSDKVRDERIGAMFENWLLPFAPPQNNIKNWCAVEKYGDWTNPKRQLADHFIKNYAFILDQNHPRIQDFDKIAKHCKENGIHIYYLILPENVELGSTLLGPDLFSVMNTSRDFLVERYHHPEYKQEVIDQMELLPDSCFFDRDFPTEHYNFDGRNAIANGVAKHLNARK